MQIVLGQMDSVAIREYSENIGGQFGLLQHDICINCCPLGLYAMVLVKVITEIPTLAYLT